MSCAQVVVSARGKVVKVVLFCGGLGTRIRSVTDPVPKPLVDIGSRPILWHLMRYYAHHGHTEFILCLGYQGHAIKRFFLDYDECLSSDFVMNRHGQEVRRSTSDVPDWQITFVDTGLHASIGERLLALRSWLRW